MRKGSNCMYSVPAVPTATTMNIEGLAEQPLGFLTLDKFLAYFPPIKISKKDFARRFTVSYKTPVTLAEIYSQEPGAKGSIIKSRDDVRWRKKQEVIDYFYEIVVQKRHEYLTHFFHSFFDFKDPVAEMTWMNGPDIGVKSTGSTKKNALNLTRKEERAGVSMQKNDASRRLIRNLFYKDILDYTRITNSVKSKVSFWQTFDNMYNRLILEDRLFAPSSIDLFLKDKRGKDRSVSGDKETNYVTMFYLIQNYQPKASILNPYTIYWILDNLLPGTKRLLTPVLSWGSYLPAFMHLPDSEYYLGIDVIPRVCAKTQWLANWYQSGWPREFGHKEVDVLCQPSESLLDCPDFLEDYGEFFDTVLFCPPYYDMEIYDGGEQSVDTYPDYDSWLEGYWHGTVAMCYLTLRHGGWFAYIANDYYDLDKNFYPLTEDLGSIASEYFTPYATYTLYNRTSPLRANHKDRSEKLFIYRKDD